MTEARKKALLLTLLVVVSAIFTLGRSGPLHGSLLALVIGLVAQVYLPGWLLARLLGKTRLPHPIARFAWVLVCGLAQTIVLGGLARLLYAPVSAYLLLLHALMLLLAWLPPLQTTAEPAWRLTRKNAALYLVVLLACVVVMGVGLTNRHRYFNFIDQVIFASHAGWLANDTAETPTGGPLRSRQVGVVTNDTRFDSDGWTYNHGAWSWASGVPAVDVVWHYVDMLFLWTVPLAVFAMAYEVTRREEAAAWSAAALVLVGMLAYDNLNTYPGYTTFGRYAVFQISTLRQAGIALMLPLTLMVGFTYLRTRQHRDLFMVILAGSMLAIMHPFQIMMFVISISVTAGLRWLVEGDRRANAARLLPLLLVLLFLLTLPFIQRLNRSGLRAADTLVRDSMLEESTSIQSLGGFLILPNLPVLGTTFIRDPAHVFYHPVILLAAALGLLHVAAVRHSQAARYIFGAALFYLLVSFVPGLTALFNRFASSVGLLTTLFLMPVALILGFSLDHGLRWLARGSRLYLAWPAAALIAGGMALLLFEPVPVPLSTRDQIQAFNEGREHELLLPAHLELVKELEKLLPPDQTSILMTTGDTANIVIQDLPRTLVTGGRSAYNRAQDGDNRFYNHLDWRMPWLDADDAAYMSQWGVTHIIVRADDTRLPQMRLQPERFPLLGEVDGLLIFARAAAEPDDVDALFGRMNAFYADIQQPRWGTEGFIMNRPVSPEIWGPVADAWRALLDAQPGDDRARLGLAFAELLAGADARALPLWRALYEAHPEIPLLADALAYTLASVGQPQAGAAVLLDALDGDQEYGRALAARSLMSEAFFHLLSSEQLDRVLSHTDSAAWAYLADFDQPDALRQRAALLMTRQRWSTAVAWLNRLPAIIVSPRDMTAQAVMMLAQGDIDGALDDLRPAADPDWRRAKESRQPDRWQGDDNRAERLYHLLNGEAAYPPASDWPPGVSEVVPVLAAAESGNPFVMQPQVTQDEASGTLTVTALYGNPQPQRGYPVEFWRIEVISPDSATRYAALDVPAVFVDEALVRVSTTLALPHDLEPLTPALVIITPAHNNAVTYTPAVVPLTLNRPGSAQPAPGAQTLGLRFGEHILLEGYALDTTDAGIDLTLYWRAEAPPPDDYQVFVHVLDSAGEMIAQDDGAPVQNRYPSSRWRTGVTIADPHVIAVDDLPDDFRVYVGLYRLSDGMRLPVTPPGERVQTDSVLLAP